MRWGLDWLAVAGWFSLVWKRSEATWSAAEQLGSLSASEHQGHVGLPAHRRLFNVTLL